MQRQILAIIMSTIFLIGILAGCGSGSANYESPGSSDYENYSNVYIKDEGFYFEADIPAESTVPEDRKIIRNASLEITAEDAANLYKNIVNYGTGIGGYEHSYSMVNYETYSVINAVFKVPPEKLGIFVKFVGENGEIINSSMSSEDITDNYYDTGTRLNTKRKSLEKYYQLLAEARGLEEIVYIQKIIDGITEDIESLEGRLNLWNSQVNMATVSLYIRQNNDPIQIRQEINWNTLSTEDIGYLIKRGFFSVTNTIISLLQWIIIILIGYSPLWISAGVVIWIVLKKWKKPTDAEDEKKRFMSFLRRK